MNVNNSNPLTNFSIGLTRIEPDDAADSITIEPKKGTSTKQTITLPTNGSPLTIANPNLRVRVTDISNPADNVNKSGVEIEEIDEDAVEIEEVNDKEVEIEDVTDKEEDEIEIKSGKTPKKEESSKPDPTSPQSINKEFSPDGKPLKDPAIWLLAQLKAECRIDMTKPADRALVKGLRCIVDPNPVCYQHPTSKEWLIAKSVSYEVVLANGNTFIPTNADGEPQKRTIFLTTPLWRANSSLHEQAKTKQEANKLLLLHITFMRSIFEPDNGSSKRPKQEQLINHVANEVIFQAVELAKTVGGKTTRTLSIREINSEKKAGELISFDNLTRPSEFTPIKVDRVGSKVFYGTQLTSEERENLDPSQVGTEYERIHNDLGTLVNPPSGVTDEHAVADHLQKATLGEKEPVHFGTLFGKLSPREKQDYYTYSLEQYRDLRIQVRASINEFKGPREGWIAKIASFFGIELKDYKEKDIINNPAEKLAYTKRMATLNEQLQTLKGLHNQIKTMNEDETIKDMNSQVAVAMKNEDSKPDRSVVELFELNKNYVKDKKLNSLEDKANTINKDFANVDLRGNVRGINMREEIARSRNNRETQIKPDASDLLRTLATNQLTEMSIHEKSVAAILAEIQNLPPAEENSEVEYKSNLLKQQIIKDEGFVAAFKGIQESLKKINASIRKLGEIPNGNPPGVEYITKQKNELMQLAEKLKKKIADVDNLIEELDEVGISLSSSEFSTPPDEAVPDQPDISTTESSRSSVSFSSPPSPSGKSSPISSASPTPPTPPTPPLTPVGRLSEKQGVKLIKGDGDCLFSSFYEGLKLQQKRLQGPEMELFKGIEDGSGLRRACVKWMKEQYDTNEPLRKLLVYPMQAYLGARLAEIEDELASLNVQETLKDIAGHDQIKGKISDYEAEKLTLTEEHFTPEVYFDKMSQSGVFGTLSELYAMKQMFNAKANVYDQFETEKKPVPPSEIVTKNTLGPILNILQVKGNHFDLVVDSEKFNRYLSS